MPPSNRATPSVPRRSPWKSTPGAITSVSSRRTRTRSSPPAAPWSAAGPSARPAPPCRRMRTFTTTSSPSPASSWPRVASTRPRPEPVRLRPCPSCRRSTADRAEAVLHDLAMNRARGEAGMAAAGNAPAAEPASVVAEREANQLLAQNQLEAARAQVRARPSNFGRRRPASRSVPSRSAWRPARRLPTPPSSRPTAALAPPDMPVGDPAAPALEDPAAAPAARRRLDPAAGQPFDPAARRPRPSCAASDWNRCPPRATPWNRPRPCWPPATTARPGKPPSRPSTRVRGWRPRTSWPRSPRPSSRRRCSSTRPLWLASARTSWIALAPCSMSWPPATSTRSWPRRSRTS